MLSCPLRVTLRPDDTMLDCACLLGWCCNNRRVESFGWLCQKSQSERVCVHKAALQTVRHELSHFILSTVCVFTAYCHLFWSFFVPVNRPWMFCLTLPFPYDCYFKTSEDYNSRVFKLSHGPEWSSIVICSLCVCVSRVSGFDFAFDSDPPCTRHSLHAVYH